MLAVFVLLFALSDDQRTGPAPSRVLNIESRGIKRGWIKRDNEEKNNGCHVSLSFPQASASRYMFSIELRTRVL